MQIVIVDGLLYECKDKQRRRAYFANRIPTMDHLEYIHVEPKPTMWQGEFRLTPENYFAASNTRNTGVCYAKYEYLAFVDDLGLISPTWLPSVIDAMNANQIHCGAFVKMQDIIYSDYKYQGGVETGYHDCRLKSYSDDISPCPGEHMFGTSFCLPKSAYFAVNGQNEMHDGVGYEDTDLGVRLKRAGYTMYYNKRMFIHESYSMFGPDISRKCIRVNPLVRDQEYNSLIRKYNLKQEDMPYRRDLMRFLTAYGSSGPIQVNPEFSLKEYNRLILEGRANVFVKPRNIYIHFFTKKPITDKNCFRDQQVFRTATAPAWRLAASSM